jgi:hypothetical protein
MMYRGFKSRDRSKRQIGKNKWNCNKREAKEYVRECHLSSYVLWHMDPLLGNDCGTNNEITAVARQRHARNNGSTVGGGVFYVVRYKAI